jgi:ABC-type nitrate/sulfonate/bicarbonate transport system substrate-binding protein
MKKKRVLQKSGIVVITIMFAVIGCAGKNESSTEDNNPGITRIRLPNTLTELAFAAERKGFFAEQNIEILWTGVQAHGPANIVSMIAGQNDASPSINTAMIDAINSGGKLTIVASSTPSGKNEPTITWLTLEDSDINSPEDFIGKKITGNSGTIAWYPVVEYFRKNNLDVNQIEFVSLPAPQTEQALRQGSVAVVGVDTTTAERIISNGGVKVLFTDYDLLGIDHIGGWAFTNDFIEKHPDAVTGFIKALSNVIKWFRESEDNYNESAEAAYSWNGRYLPKNWGPGDEMLLLSDSDLQAWIDILVIYGNIRTGQYEPSDIYTNRFNPHYQQ